MALATPKIRKMMLQIMLQTEIMFLLAPRTMYSKLSPTAPLEPTLPCLIFSAAQHFHALTPMFRMRTHTFLSTLPLPHRAAAFTKFPSHLLQAGIHRD
jgi:hypothetical protein